MSEESFVKNEIPITETPSAQPEEKPARTIALRVAYDGTNYSGWQRQPKLRTVQGCIEDAVESLVYPDGTPLEKRPQDPDWPVIEVRGSSACTPASVRLEPRTSITGQSGSCGRFSKGVPSG